MDLKPSNVVEVDGEFKLIDFENVDKIQYIDLSYDRLTTPLYAPKQFNDRQTIRSDIYDVVTYGKTLYELLYGDIKYDLCFEENSAYFQYNDRVRRILTKSEFDLVVEVFKYSMNSDLNMISPAKKLKELRWFGNERKSKNKKN
eukprot:NODE_279_length_10886_cov_0.340039.p10 type:complete len:144 gc:universal NODE_279_length_10886_cov_0.340039:5872-5441(-)